jgi:hypothetical protein
MKKSVLFGCTVGLFFSISVASPAQANRWDACPASPTAANDSQMREIDLKKYGIKFKIPANYKTRTHVNDGQMDIMIINPSNLEYADCLVKNQIGTEYSYIGANILIGNVVQGATLVGMAKTIQAQNHSKEISDLEHTKIANQLAIRYKILTAIGYMPVALLFTPNQKSFLQIRYEPSDNNATDRSKEVADMVAKSLVLKPAESPKYPSNAEMQELKRKFDLGIKRVEWDRTGAGYVRDRRTESDKQSLQSFSQAWAKIDPTIVPFLGSWSGYKHTITVYPSASLSKVCIVTSGEGFGNVQVSEIRSGLLHYNRDFFLWRQGRYLGMGKFDGSTSGFPSDIPHNNPRPLEAIEAFLSQRIVDSSNREEMVRSFYKYGCTSATAPTKPDFQANKTAEQSKQTLQQLPDGTYLYAEDPQRVYRGTNAFKFRKKGNLVFGEFFISMEPQGCVVARVSGQSIEAGMWLGLTPTVGGKPHSPSFISKSVDLRSYSKVTSKDLESIPSDSFRAYLFSERITCEGNFKDLERKFLEASAPAASSFPQNSRNEAVNPPSRLASNSSIASAHPPSPQEIARITQQNRTSQGVAKLSQSQLNDRQKLRNQTSKYLAPFAGGWLTADNQRIFVYPSSRKDRQACIIVEKDGAQDLQIGVANGNATGTDINIGDVRLFNTKQATFALRRPGSDQLIAVQPFPGSANLTTDHRSAMEGNGCITSFPSTAIATAPTKPAFQANKTFKSVKAFGLEQMLGSNQSLTQVPLDLEKLAQEKYSLPKFPKLYLLSEKLTDVREQKGKFLGSRKDISFQDYLTLKLKVKAQSEVLMNNAQAMNLADQYLEHFQKDRQKPHPLVKDVAAQFAQAVGQNNGSQRSFGDRLISGIEETRVASGKFVQGIFNTGRDASSAWVDFDALIKLMPSDSERKKLQLIQELSGDGYYLSQVNSQMEAILEASRSGNLDKANRELAKLATATLKWVDDSEKTGKLKSPKRGAAMLQIVEDALQLKDSVQLLQNAEVNGALNDFDKTYLTTASIGSALDIVGTVSAALLPEKSAPAKIVEKAKSVKTILFDTVKFTYSDHVRREHNLLSEQYDGNQKKIQGLSAAFDFSGEEIGKYLLRNRTDVLKQTQNGSVEVSIKETVYPRN